MNHTLSVLTPDQFQTLVIAWIGAIVAITAALGFALSKIKPVLQQIEELFRRTDAQNNRIESQQKQITDVALATPTVVTPITATPTSPVPVKVENTEADPVPTHPT